MTFAIVAGLVFGPVPEPSICSVATTLGAMVAFVVGRFSYRTLLNALAMKGKYLKKWLFVRSETHEVFVDDYETGSHYFPYNLQNFVWCDRY